MKQVVRAFLALACFLLAGAGFSQLGTPSAAQLGTPGTPAAVSGTYSIWPSSSVPQIASFEDPTPNEVGVKFYSDSNGFITAIRFYKGPLNTGVHIAHLWDSQGDLLATATFTDETATGWQQVTLPNPVPITAGTIYVASYWDPNGGYSLNRPYFTSQYNNPPLHALANTADGPNGVYFYNSSGYPTSTYDSSNYWVDVVFSTSAGPAEKEAVSSPTVSSISPVVGSVSGGATVTINGSNFASEATVSFGGVKATAVTFSNSAQLQAVTPPGAVGTVTVTVTNPDGGRASLANSFSYDQGPAVTSVSPASGPATGGTTVTINGSGFESGALVAFGTTPASSVTVVSPTEIQAVAPAQAVAAVGVTVTNPDSTVGTLPSAFTFLAAVATLLPPPSSGALLTGMTSSNYTVPAGWTLVTADSFENGSLPAGQGFYGGSNTESINCSFAHTGNCSLDTYVTHSYGGLGLVINGNYINSRETDVSWWQYVQQNNPGYGVEYTDWYISGRNLTSGSSNVDGLDADWDTYTDGTVCIECQIGLYEQNSQTSTGPAPWAVYFGGPYSTGLGQWVQFEVHLKVNDPGTDDGLWQVYENGQQVAQLYAGIAGVNTSRCPVFNGSNDCGYFVGNQDFTDADLWIPGDWGAVTSSGSNQNMASCTPASYCPPNGSIPYFHIYIDDVIVLKK